ncbi:Protein FAM22G [Tupaia chinensis]|uniref:Protein FAM22G n=1 Tax=Tupaia chinensis TaxID=246437 RepID=L9JML5_TUPCH|nr:Protein FAM22G [Tupaia chinensis]
MDTSRHLPVTDSDFSKTESATCYTWYFLDYVFSLCAERTITAKITQPISMDVTVTGGADGAPPLLLAAPAVQTLTLAPSAGVSQVIRGGLTPAQPPPAPALVAQITPIMAPATTGTQPQMAFADGHLGASQAKASLDDSCIPGSVYRNFRRWQRFKTLARSHLPQSPDGEALSCFFM